MMLASHPKDLAISFCQSYERTENDYEGGQEWAEEWYKYFLGISDIREYFESEGF